MTTTPTNKFSRKKEKIIMNRTKKAYQMTF